MRTLCNVRAALRSQRLDVAQQTLTLSLVELVKLILNGHSVHLRQSVAGFLLFLLRFYFAFLQLCSLRIPWRLCVQINCQYLVLSPSSPSRLKIVTRCGSAFTSQTSCRHSSRTRVFAVSASQDAVLQFVFGIQGVSEWISFHNVLQIFSALVTLKLGDIFNCLVNLCENGLPSSYSATMARREDVIVVVLKLLSTHSANYMICSRLRLFNHFRIFFFVRQHFALRFQVFDVLVV